jgi:hypothetical protein
VEVNHQAAQYSDDLLAVLAHEITHIYLFRIGLSFDDTMENEILTDTAATYSGLRTLILNAYSCTKWFDLPFDPATESPTWCPSGNTG